MFQTRANGVSLSAMVELNHDGNSKDVIARSLTAGCDLQASSTQDPSPLPPVSLCVSRSLETELLLKQDKVIFNYSTGILAVQ